MGGWRVKPSSSQRGTTRQVGKSGATSGRAAGFLLVLSTPLPDDHGLGAALGEVAQPRVG